MSKCLYCKKNVPKPCSGNIQDHCTWCGDSVPSNPANIDTPAYCGVNCRTADQDFEIGVGAGPESPPKIKKPEQFTPDELHLIVHVFGDRHKDKDISDEEAALALHVYTKAKRMCQPVTKKKRKKL